MSILRIKDLTESIALDRQAMLAITGGSRRSGYISPLQQQALPALSLAGYPASPGRLLADAAHAGTRRLQYR